MLLPISFGVRVASVPIVGMAMGQTWFSRARKGEWGPGRSGAGTQRSGLVGPDSSRSGPTCGSPLFTRDPGRGRRRRISLFRTGPGPAFGLFRLGSCLYFSSARVRQKWSVRCGGRDGLGLVAGLGFWRLVAGTDGARGLETLVRPCRGVAMTAYGLGDRRFAVAGLTRWGNWTG